MRDAVPLLVGAASDAYEHGDRIERVIAHHAALRPDAVALEQGDERLSYAQLVAAADAVAARLAKEGIGPGDVVPVCLGRSTDLVVALLGVLTAGAAYIAMDPAWPSARRADVLRDCGARLQIGTDRSGSDLSLLDPSDMPAGPDRPALPMDLDGRAPACVFYTSGSTGRPKGVLSPHRGTIRTLVGCPTVPLDRETVFLQAAPLAWDAASMELWGPLLNGGRCVLLDRRSDVLDADALRKALRRGLNTLWLTSSLFNLFAEEAPDLLGRLRLLLVGGERVSPRHVRTILDRFPAVQVVNGYGPAECTIFATTHVIRPADVSSPGADVPIGRPIPYTGVALVDAEGRRVGRDEPGEVALSGDGLATGYLAAPDETARRFFDLDGVRHYRTGDVASLDAEGNLRYRGRADRQFKINGVRIEPGEVEAVLESHPRVAACCVVRLEPTAGQPQVGFLYVSTDGAAIDAGELRAVAAPHLLNAMIPTVLHQVDRLPLGATGKTDPAAAALLLADHLAAVRTASPSAPAVASGDIFLDQVRELLDLPQLEAEDNIFAAGATSLDAVRLAARTEAWLGALTTVADIYRLGSLAEIRAAAETAPPSGGFGGTGGDIGPAPLSHAQTRFWMAEQMSPASADNMVVLAYLLTGKIDEGLLESALREMVSRHHALRTVYHWASEAPEQHVLPDGALRLQLERVMLPPGSGELGVAAAARLATDNWWHRPFDLEKELPIRARVADLGEGRWLLCLQVHHVCFDGWSENRLIDHLADVYTAYLLGQVPNVTEWPSYAEYSRWERTSLELWLRAELPFWRRTLAKVPEPVLPPPASIQEAPRRELTAKVPAEAVRRLHQAAGRHGGPGVATLLAAVGQAVARRFDVPDVCLGTVTAGRPDAALEPLVGYFVNPLVVPLPSARDDAPESLLKRAAKQVVAGLAHARTPFDELVRALGPPRDRHPWFQIWVVLQQQPPSRQLGPDLSLQAVRIPPPATALELMFEAVPQPDGGWELILLHREDGVDPRTAAQLLNDTVATLNILAGR